MRSTVRREEAPSARSSRRRAPHYHHQQQGHASSVVLHLLVAAAVALLVAPYAVRAGGSTDKLSVSSKSIGAFVEDFAGRYVGSSTPGLAVAVVKDGKTVYAGGFGSRTAGGSGGDMTANTLVRVGGLSELVTATAVMQLRDAGRLESLDDSLEQLVPGVSTTSAVRHQGIDVPITIRHALAHAGGWEGKLLGQWASRARVLANSSEVLREFPRRVRNPGAPPLARSAHGYAALAHLVSALTETPFDEYASDMILKPLGMTASTMRGHDAQDPVVSAASSGRSGKGKGGDESTVDGAASGHIKKVGAATFTPLDLYANNVAGSLVTTASDAAQLLKMALNGGKANGHQIVSKDAARDMTEMTIGSFPGSDSGATLGGWLERVVRGSSGATRILVQTGDMPGFSSLAALFPADRVGVFLAINAGAPSVRAQFLDEFVTKFASAEKEDDGAKSGKKRQQSSGSVTVDLKPYVGTYRTVQNAYTTIEASAHLLSQIKVELSPSGNSLLVSRIRTEVPTSNLDSASIAGASAPTAIELTPTQSSTLPADGSVRRAGDLIVFSAAASGQRDAPAFTAAIFPGGTESNAPSWYLVTNAVGREGPVAFEPVSYTESAEFVVPVTTAAHAVFAAYTLLWLVKGLIGAMRAPTVIDADKPVPSATSRLENLAAATSLTHLVFVGLVALSVWKAGGLTEVLSAQRMPAGMRFLFFGPFIAQIMSISLLTNLAQELRKNSPLQLILASAVMVMSTAMMVVHYQMRTWIFHV
ncbi:hypothetical protein H9P43_010162 [Blastocladiella emersonii ATCC 22665]|nr:hypothetical protein H9P43_010162 [Blastocladiella emersonii ATCC 22665]